LTVCSGALLNAYSSQQSLFNRNITLEYSSIVISENSASNCSVFALHSGDARRPMAKQFPYGADELLNGNGLIRLVYGLGDPIPI
jgi:hypothetical protein